jgi:hypothetical protein
MLHIVSVPPMFDMGKGLKECEGDLLTIVEHINNPLAELTISPKHVHLSDLVKPWF